MKIYLEINGWIDISEYVDLDSILHITADGTYSNATIVCRFPSTFKAFNVKNPLKPKTKIKITDSEEEIELVNTFYFITSDISSVKMRNEIIKNDNVVVSALYEHTIKMDELLSILDGKYGSDYTITQPKTKYFDSYRKSATAEFLLNNVFIQDGGSKILPVGDKESLQSQFNDDEVITFDYDSYLSNHYVELKDIDEKSFILDFEMIFRKTAKTYISYKMLGKTFKKVIAAVKEIETSPFYETQEGSKLSLFLTTFYYDELNNLISSKNENIDTTYIGGEVPGIVSSQTAHKVTGFSKTYSTFSYTIDIPKNENAKKVRVHFGINPTPKEYQLSVDTHWGYIKNEFSYGGVDYDTNRVMTNIQSIKFKATSSAYEDQLVEKETTLYEFLVKVMYDYNLNKRDKVEIDSALRPLLDITAKESEWADYNYRELVERIFKYVGLRPYLTNDNVLTYIKEQKIARYIDLEEETQVEKDHKGEHFFDKIVSKSKNLVSENDFVTEIIPLTSLDEEFSQITSDTVGFLTSNNIYYIAEGFLHTPNLVFNIGGNIIKGNTDTDYKWNITSRLFEEDIYNSFPDVRLDIIKDSLNDGYSLRGNPDLYSKSNTISYKSGSNYVSNLGHLSPEIPDYDWFRGIFSQTPSYLIAQYSVIEMLVVLAYTQLASSDVDFNPFVTTNFDLILNDIQDFTLEITYAPIYKEITTKHSSNIKERKGLNYEKKFNVLDRTISYDESSKVLRAEMENKGNITMIYSEKVSKLEDTMPINAIINDNYYITSKTITMKGNLINVDYELQQNFILQNEDIRLPVEFDRYTVPYEYVNREIMLENHLIFSIFQYNKYRNDKKTMGIDFLKRTLGATFYGGLVDTPLYAMLDIYLKDSKIQTLMRLGKIETDFTMILSGRFLDNYSAGVQRFLYIKNDNDLLYSQPFRYTDVKGRIDNIANIKIGYDSHSSNIYKLDNYSLYDFPNAKEKVIKDFSTKLVEFNEMVMFDKDAREGIALTHTSYLENDGEDIKFYSFKPITHIGILKDKIDFLDNLTIDDIDYIEIDNGIEDVIIQQGIDGFNIRIKTSENVMPYREKGLILFNKDSNKYSLIGLVRNYNYYDDGFKIFIYNTMYGFFEDINKTQVPLIKNVYLEEIGNNDYEIYLGIENRDEENVIIDGDIQSFDSFSGTLKGKELKLFFAGSTNLNIIGNEVNITIKAQASGKDESYSTTHSYIVEEY